MVTVLCRPYWANSRLKLGRRLRINADSGAGAAFAAYLLGWERSSTAMGSPAPFPSLSDFARMAGRVNRWGCKPRVHL